MSMWVDLENVGKVKELHDLLMTQNKRGHVIDLFRDVPTVLHAAKINHWGDTVLHLAVQTSSDATVKRLVDTPHASHTLSVKNDAGDTPLHAVAARGSESMCRCIVNGQTSLIKERNNNGETPVFLAAINGRRDAFRYLLDAAADEDDRLSCCRRRLNGDTILHCTIRNESFDMSLLVIEKCKEICFGLNERGQTPLQILASIPFLFQISSQLHWWERIWVHLIKKYAVKFMRGMTIAMFDDADVPRLFRRITGKEKTERALQIMRKLLEEDIWYDYWIETDILAANNINIIPTFDEASSSTMTTTSKNPSSDKRRRSKGPSALLAAARNGTTEMVKEILRRKPYAIEDETSDKKNILLVAIEERQSEILKELMKHPRWSGKRLKYACDEKGNTAVHLAAKRFINANRADIVHLPWEIYWYLYVRNIIMPPHLEEVTNNEGKTPEMVFAEEHERALERSDESVKTMLGNYIVAAVLISGATFATAYQIPGGYNSGDGMPVIRPTTPAFRTFSVSALVSFCFSITSLAVFLSIYSSPNNYTQYLQVLPMKLCFGLSTLFISIVSMLLSFCAAHTFEFDPKHKSYDVPFYVALALLILLFTLKVSLNSTGVFLELLFPLCHPPDHNPQVPTCKMEDRAMDGSYDFPLFLI